MKRMAISAAVVSTTIVLASVGVAAHHSDAGRYEETLTTVTGTVVEFQLVNPHSMVILDVTGPDGKVARWRGEAGSATQLKRFGLARDSITFGDTLTITGRRARNGSPFMTLSEGARIVDASGKELFHGN